MMVIRGRKIACVLCGNEIRGLLKPATPVEEGLCCETCFEKMVKPTRLHIALGVTNGPMVHQK